MLSVLGKELNSFFSSLIGYIAIIVFLVATALYLWIFPDTNVFNGGYATLDTFFSIAPSILMFLVPAITMRLLSEEQKARTIEFLLTKPLRDIDIVLGKYFASLVVVLFALLPTLIYFYSIIALGANADSVDKGAIWGSYIGLFFLGASFAAIGLFSSSVTSNQVVAFVLGVFLCFIFYLSFDLFSNLQLFYAKVDYIIQQLGINRHYQSISRGVVDSRDVIYFLSLITAFLLLTKFVIGRRKWQ